MTFKILVVGSSYSAGSTDETHTVPMYWGNTWSSHLQKKLNCKIYNYGISGSDVFLTNLMLRETIDTVKPDIVIFEITDAHRHSYSSLKWVSYKIPKVTDWLDIVQVSDNYYTIQQPHYFDYNKLTDKQKERYDNIVIGHNKKDIKPLIVAWAQTVLWNIEMVAEFGPYGKKEIPAIDIEHANRNELKFVYDRFHEIFSDREDSSMIEAISAHKSDMIRQETLTTYHNCISAIESAKFMCEKRNIKHLFFDWYRRTAMYCDRITPYDVLDSSTIDFTIYHKFPNMELYIYDEIYHLNPEGHKIASEIVFQEMKNKGII